MEVILNNRVVNVVIVYKKIKNIYFRFDESCNLCVNANKHNSDKVILKLIEKNRSSLERMMVKVEKKKEKSKEFWYIGNSYELIYDDTAQ